MSIHGRRSSVSGGEPSFDTSDYRFSSSSPCFLSTVSRDLFPRAPPLKLSTERRKPRFVRIIDPSFRFVANLYIYSCSREKSSFQGAMLIDDCKGKSLKLCFIVFQAISMMVHVSRKKMEYLVGILIFLFPFFFFSLVSF